MTRFLVFSGLLACVIYASGADTFKQWSFDFADSDFGFQADYADLMADFDPERFDLVADRRALPDELDSEKALYISGTNLSDDLWMYWKKRLTGLQPDSEYLVTLEIEFASQDETGSIGIGGSPGDSVFLKGGVTTREPVALPDDTNILRMNIDKGNQADGGEDIRLLGTIAKPEDGSDDYVLLSKDTHGDAQTVATAEDGSLWLSFGTDSGFEGNTALFYTRLRIWANQVGEPKIWLDRQPAENRVRLIWNNGSLETSNKLREWGSEQDPPRPFPFEPAPSSGQFWRLVRD